MKLNKIFTLLATAGLLSTTAYANCVQDNVTTGWTGSITFHCDSETNLKDNPIQFDIDDGIKLSSAWGLDANPKLEQNGNHITVTTTNWYPADTARIAQPNQSLTLSFSATNGMLGKIENFKVGNNTPKYQGNIDIKLPSKPSFINDNTHADVVVFKKLIDGYAKVGEFNQSQWGETIHLSVNLNSPSQGIYVMVKSLNGHTGSATPNTFRLSTGKTQTVTISYESIPEETGNLECQQRCKNTPLTPIEKVATLMHPHW